VNLAQEPVLNVKDLCITYPQKGEWVRAVNQVSFQIQPGQTLGLVGESGSGKTTFALAALRYLPEQGMICEGEFSFLGQNLLELSKRDMREIWGSQMSFVPQDARSSLNPSLTIGVQVGELLRYKLDLSQSAAVQRMRELFQQVQLSDIDRVISSYPHQISGGMLQRVLTAMAISTEPDLLILDEPTSSLDVTTQAAILDLFRQLLKDHPSTAVLYITHNLGVVSQLCDRIAVLYASELVEIADTQKIYRQARHPYTTALIDSVPRLGENKSKVKLRPIQGRIPPLGERPSGCVFEPRCPLAIDICHEYPPLYEVAKDHLSRCHRWEEIKAGEVNPRQPMPEYNQNQERADQAESTGPLLQMEDIHVHFQKRRSILKLLYGKTSSPVKAVNDIDLSIPKGQITGLVGESGSGKTTLARSILGIHPADQGEFQFQGENLPKEISQRDLQTLSEIQIVFQDPEDTLNPYRSVRQILQRPLHRFRRFKKDDLEEQVHRLLDAVHLSPELSTRLPDQLSGGEKQRVAIARSLATQPQLVIADEPISSLDVSVQASILNLFNKLQIQESLSLLFISHDLAVVGYLADEIAVMYLGQLMEHGPTESAFDPPFHPYMEALLSSVPLIDPDAEQQEIRLKGEVPKPSEDIHGCPFHSRCPRFLGEICVEETPPWREDSQSEKWYFCHIPAEDLKEQQTQVFTFHNHQEDH